MTLRLPESIKQAMFPRVAAADEALHFHVRSDGVPFLCELARCDSPGLTLGEADPLSALPVAAARPHGRAHFLRRG